MSDQETKTDEVPEEVNAVHPFVTLLFATLRRTGGEERYLFPPESVDEVYSGLVEYEGSDEFPVIIEQLLGLALMMQQQLDSPSVAAQIMAILEDERIENITRDVKALADPNLDELGNRFGSFVGNETAKTAPKVGEEKPEGALSLDQLNFPKRM